MIAIDTNILVRLVVNDDQQQAKRAVKLIHDHPVFISKTVILETEWVLRYAYKLDRNAIVEVFEKIFGLEEISIEDEGAVSKTISWYKSGFDFADAFHLASSHQIQKFATFDRDLGRRAKLVNEIEVMVI